MSRFAITTWPSPDEELHASSPTKSTNGPNRFTYTSSRDADPGLEGDEHVLRLAGLAGLHAEQSRGRRRAAGEDDRVVGGAEGEADGLRRFDDLCRAAGNELGGVEPGGIGVALHVAALD